LNGENNDKVTEQGNDAKVPERLYKYFGPERCEVLDNWLVRFTQAGALNDPFELKPHIASYGTSEELREVAERKWEEHAKERYEELAAKYTNPMPFSEFRRLIEKDRSSMIEEALARDMTPVIEEMAAKISSMINESIGILSLCEHPDDLLMWAHYAAGHAGFVLEFDTKSAFFNQKNPPGWANANNEDTKVFSKEYGWIRKVCYSVERPSVVVTKLDFGTLLRKGKPWAYECEFRMLMPLEYGLQCALERTNNYPVCLFPIPPSAVTRIILGCNSEAELLEKATRLKTAGETRHIAVEKARIDTEGFRLHFDPL